MAQAKTANNKKRGSQRERYLDGQKVTLCVYDGRAAGHGKYKAGMIGDALVQDNNGRPIPYHQIGELR